MSLVFSDTSGKDGILQMIEQTLGLPDAYITGDSTRLAQWTGRVNLALDKVFSIIFQADGRWQFDDGNHTTYPILTGNLEDGRRDYSFTADSDGNLVLSIDRVFAKTSSSGPYYEIFPVDVQRDSEGTISGFVDGLNTEGAPYTYDKTATGIFLDPIPNANVTNGLKVYVSREGSYFLTSDTTKKPGFTGLFHEYLVLEPSYKYARANGLKNQEVLKRDILEMEKAIIDHYSKRDRHDVPVMTSEPIIYE
jgi:hypothetical protein